LGEGLRRQRGHEHQKDAERALDGELYDITNPSAPVFDQYIYLPDHVSPEGLAFISAADSPNGAAMLVVDHEISGTVAILQPFV
jgi:hypothetical protein